MADYSRLQNGSDVRGVALPGVAGEPVTFTTEAAGRIAGAPLSAGCPSIQERRRKV